LENASCHHSGGTKNFEVAPSFSENLCITDVNSDGTHKPSFGLNLSSCRITDSRLCINPLKPELNSICYLLALLGAHHFFHVSRIRVKLLNFRLIM
jgi:hypothetical protein